MALQEQITELSKDVIPERYWYLVSAFDSAIMGDILAQQHTALSRAMGGAALGFIIAAAIKKQ